MNVFERMQSAGDAGLVREEEKMIASRACPLECGGDAGNQFNSYRIGEVMLVEDQRSIAIKK